MVVNRARSSCEVLEDASLVACLMFDSGSELVDSGTNDLVSVSTAFYVSNGHSQQAVSFNGSTSAYYKISSLTSLGMSDQPFTIALWIRPRSLVGIVLHLSETASGSGTWCMPLIAFASNGSILAQMFNTQPRYLVGPILTLLNMSHIVETWSPANGIRLYVDGVLAGSKSILTNTYTASGVSNYGILGNSLSGAAWCTPGYAGSMSPFNGDIDDFRIYNRELTPLEVNTLYLL